VVLVAVVFDRDVPLGIGGVDAGDEPARATNLELGNRFGQAAPSDDLEHQRLHLALGWPSVRAALGEKAPERAHTIASRPPEAFDGGADRFERDQLALFRRVERHLDN